MLGIKRETDYAVRTVLHLAALGPGASVQVRDVADQKLLPLSFVRRIVARLGAAGILSTTRGMGGGVELSRPPSSVTLLDVCRAMDDDVVLNRCVDGEDTCPFLSGCPARMAWAEATDVLTAHLATVTFEALARRSALHPAAHRRRPPAPRDAPAAPPRARQGRARPTRAAAPRR